MPELTTTELVIDTTAFTAAMTRTIDAIREAFRPLAEVMAKGVRQLSRLVETMREHANDPVRIAGLEARYYVRASMDPAYRSPERLDALVQAIVTGTEQGADDNAPLWHLITPGNRRAVAVSAMLGWATVHDEPAAYVAHRAWGADRVEVRCG